MTIESLPSEFITLAHRGQFFLLILMMLMNVTDNYSYLRATEGKKENIQSYLPTRFPGGLVKVI